MPEKLSLQYRIRTPLLYYTIENFQSQFGMEAYNYCVVLYDKVFCRSCADKHYVKINELIPNFPVSLRPSTVDYMIHLKKCDECGSPLWCEYDAKYKLGKIDSPEKWELCQEYVAKLDHLVDEYLTKFSRLSQLPQH